MQKDKLAIQVGEKIREIRQAKGLSQRELSGQVNVDRATLTHYELGDRLPSIFILWDIADYLDVSLDELVGRK